MRRISGPDDARIRAWEAELEGQVVESLQHVMDTIADRVLDNAPAAMVASAQVRMRFEADSSRDIWADIPWRVPVLVAAVTTGPTGDDDPPPQTADLAIPAPEPVPAAIPDTPDLPPGQPWVSPDDLASIVPLWQEQLAGQVMPIVAQIFVDSALGIRGQLVDAAPAWAMPRVGSLAAEQYLAGMQDRFDDIGMDAWSTARDQLGEGFAAGESVPQLAARLRQTAGLTAREAVLVARTSVIDASNNGSISMARASGLTMLKTWIATNDTRTRLSHLVAEQRYEANPIPLDESFIVGGHPCDYPASPDLPPAEGWNCRCTVGYALPEQAEATVEQPAALLPGTTPPPDGEVAAKLPGEGDLGGVGGLGDEPVPAGLLEAGDGRAVRASLVRAGSPAELRQVWQDEMRAITGRMIPVGELPAGISPLTAREYAEGVLTMLERFPEARLRGIDWYTDLTSPEYAQVKRGGGIIYFNMRWAAEDARRKLLSTLRNDVSGWRTGDSGWSVRGATMPQSVAFHEFVHVVELENLGDIAPGKLLGLIQRHADALGIRDDDVVRRFVSSYADKNLTELVAEAGTDVVLNGARASAFSQDVYRLMVEEYRARGFAIRDLPDGEAFPKLPAPRPLASMTVKDLRALAKERGITVPAGARKADLVAALERAPAASVVPEVARAALTGVKAERAAPIRVEIDASAGAETSRWRATDVTVLEGAERRALLSAMTNRVRTSGGFNEYLRFPEGRPDRWSGYSPESQVMLEQMEAQKRASTIAQAQKDIKAIDAAMERSHLSVDITVYRGVRPSDFGLPEDAVGFEWTDPAYLGTSAQRSVAQNSFAEGALLRIHVPEGTPAISITGGGEGELLLGRGLRLKVTRDARDGGVRVLDVEVVPPAAVEAPAVDLATQAVTRQALIDERRAVADALSEARFLVDNQATAAALASRARLIAKRVEGAGAAGEDLGPLVRAMAAGDRDAIDTAISDIAAARQLTQVGAEAGRRFVPFDPKLHEMTAGIARPAPGTFVGIERPGYAGELPGGEVVQLGKTRVYALDADEAALARAEAVELRASPPPVVAPASPAAPAPVVAPPVVRAPAITGQDLAGRRAKLESALRSPESSRTRLPSEGGGTVYRVEHADGSTTVTKTYDRTGTKAVQKRDADADELGSLVSEAVGVRAPVIARTGPTSFEQEFIAGRSGADLTDGGYSPIPADILASDDAHLLGLADLLMGNTDRNAGNWIRLSDGRLAAIDHGEAFRRAGIAAGPPGQFVDLLPSGGKLARTLDVSPVDVAVLRGRLALLEPEFTRLGRATWYRQMMARFEQVAKRASGTKVRIASEAEAAAQAQTLATDAGKAVRAAARDRARVVETARGNAALLADLDRLIQARSPRSAILEALDPKLTGAGQLYAGADPAIVATIRDALATGDAAKLRSAVTRMTTRAKTKPIGKAGAKTAFDPATMEPLPGAPDIPAGAQVVVVRRGATFEGLTDPLEKARVTTVAPKPKAPPKPRATRVPRGRTDSRPAAPTRGSDLLAETEDRGGMWIAEAMRFQSRRDGGKWGNNVLTEAIRHQPPEWSAPGRAATAAEVDRAVAQGWVEIWRGVKTPFSETPTAAQISRATIDGEWRQGNGMYGSGTYTTTRRTTGEAYRGSRFLDAEGREVRFQDIPDSGFESGGRSEWRYGFQVEEPGGLLRMALSPDAHLIDYDDLVREHDAFVLAARQRGELNWSDGSGDLPFYRAIRDRNFYAVLRGFDGVRLRSAPGVNDGAPYPGGVRNLTEADQYVIFNRGVLMFDGDSLQP